MATSPSCYLPQVVLPGNVQESDVTGLLAASRVSMREGSGLQHTEAWVALRAGELLLFPTDAKRAKERLALFGDQQHSTFQSYTPLCLSNKRC